MSFSPYYYKPLCDYLLELLKPINSSNHDLEKELIHRDFVSRSYYTALLYCRDTLGDLTEDCDGGTHEQIIKSSCDEVQEYLRNLKYHRVNADYKSRTFPMPLKYKKANVTLERISAIVNNILSKDKESIKK